MLSSCSIPTRCTGQIVQALLGSITSTLAEALNALKTEDTRPPHHTVLLVRVRTLGCTDTVSPAFVFCPLSPWHRRTSPSPVSLLIFLCLSSHCSRSPRRTSPSPCLTMRPVLRGTGIATKLESIAFAEKHRSGPKLVGANYSSPSSPLPKSGVSSHRVRRRSIKW